MKHRLRIGVISDTHGLLRPEALEALAGVAHILHAGDIGGPEVLEGLGKIAPVTAVRGNVDRGAWARPLPETVLVEVAGNFLYVLHDLSRLDVHPRAADLAAVIYGHSHVAGAEKRDGVLYFNPGSAGPLRFHTPATLGILEFEGPGIRESFLSL
ncbi:MAG: metallophosphoesterase family protein [Acidobacteria bacterium]|nr:metallophosphoesterase family protein [Acidobacteriota bacterium]